MLDVIFGTFLGRFLCPIRSLNIMFSRLNCPPLTFKLKCLVRFGPEQPDAAVERYNICIMTVGSRNTNHERQLEDFCLAINQPFRLPHFTRTTEYYPGMD